MEADGAAGPGSAFLGETTVILVGYDGQLAAIARNLAVLGVAWSYLAIGSGRARAYGALYALGALGAPYDQRSVEIALEAAAATTPTVRPPYRYLTLPPAAGLRAGCGADQVPASR